jgi:hypothetical protein
MREADVMAPFQDGAESNRAPGGDVAGPYDELSRVLAVLPRPRVVRMSRRGKIMAMVVSIALAASLVIYAASGLAIRRTAGEQNSAPSQFPVHAISIAFIVVFALVVLNVFGKQKQLLADGEIAMAQVTKRWLARNGPNIRYEFTTPLGEHFSRGAPDGSGQLSAGMNVPIFYDPRNPKKQLALCSSFYEVVLPGKD